MRGLLTILMVAGVCALKAQAPVEGTTKETMRFKLHLSQGVLEGITAENFPLISTNAIRLKQLSRHRDWRVRGTREYERLTADYERATESLQRAARNRNADAAMVAYFQLTTSCVTCHRYLRGADVGLWKPRRQTVGMN